MKKEYFLIAAIALITGCKGSGIIGDCPKNIACTYEFRSISVKFTDQAGVHRKVSDYKVLDVQRNQQVTADRSESAQIGWYKVVDDNYTGMLSTSGSKLLVSYLDTVNNQRGQVEFKAKGGKCACHIEKLEGPVEVKLR